MVVRLAIGAAVGVGVRRGIAVGVAVGVDVRLTMSVPVGVAVGVTVGLDSVTLVLHRCEFLRFVCLQAPPPPTITKLDAIIVGHCSAELRVVALDLEPAES